MYTSIVILVVLASILMCLIVLISTVCFMKGVS